MGHLAPAAAGGAGLGRGAGLHPLPFAPLAQDPALHGNFLVHALEHFIQGQGDGVAQVSPGLGPAGAVPPAAEPEEILKNIPEIAENVLEAAEAARIEALQAFRTIDVVDFAFFRVGEDLVGLGDFFEFFLRGFVAGIAVGVMLEGELAVGAFDFFQGGVLQHPQQFIIIQCSLPPRLSPSSLLGY